MLNSMDPIDLRRAGRMPNILPRLDQIEESDTFRTSMPESITLHELDARRAEIFEGIVARREIWAVTENDGAGFMLGPEDLFSKVLGLYGEDYGWPVRIDADAPADAFAPGPRRHPFIHRGDQLIAIAISKDEYADLIR